MHNMLYMYIFRVHNIGLDFKRPTQRTPTAITQPTSRSASAGITSAYVIASAATSNSASVSTRGLSAFDAAEHATSVVTSRPLAHWSMGSDPALNATTALLALQPLMSCDTIVTNQKTLGA